MIRTFLINVIVILKVGSFDPTNNNKLIGLILCKSQAEIVFMTSVSLRTCVQFTSHSPCVCALRKRPTCSVTVIKATHHFPSIASAAEQFLERGKRDYFHPP